MFEENEEKKQLEKKQQFEIAKKIIEKLEFSSPSLERIETLKRIGESQPELRGRVNEVLKKWGASGVASSESEIREVEKEFEGLKSGLNSKQSPFYKTSESEQIEKITNIIEKTMQLKDEKAGIGLIRLLQNISLNTPHKNVRMKIIEGLNEIAIKKARSQEGVEAALTYEKLVSNEENGRELILLSQLHRMVMMHPAEVSPLTRQDEELTFNRIEKIKTLGLNPNLKRKALEYLENIQNHPNHLVKKWAFEALSHVKGKP